MTSPLFPRKPNLISDINFVNSIYLHFIPSRIRGSSVSIVSGLLVGCQNNHSRGNTFVITLKCPDFLRVHRWAWAVASRVKRSKPEA